MEVSQNKELVKATHQKTEVIKKIRTNLVSREKEGKTPTTLHPKVMKSKDTGTPIKQELTDSPRSANRPARSQKIPSRFLE